MPEKSPDPPVLSYENPAWGAATHRPAAAILLVWGCLSAAVALLATLLTLFLLLGVLLKLPRFSDDVSPDPIFILVCVSLALFAIVLTRTAIGSIRVAVRFLHHQPVNVRSVINVVSIFETLTFMAGGVMVLFLFCFVGWTILLGSGPLFIFGSGLTFTRHVLLRVRYPESTTNESASPPP
jgi:hypothetical protein